MTTVSELMIIERLLLEIENRFKFSLSFENVRLLYDYLKTVGKVTNLFFMLQEDYYNKFNDEEKLKEYHNKLLNDKVSLNTYKIVRFIDWVNDTTDDEEFKNLVTKNKFWGINETD